MRWASMLLLALLMGACGGTATAPTPTPEPTATLEPPPATATPVPASADVQLGAWRVREAPNGMQVYIEGEAVNVGEADAQEVMVTIRLYDAAGVILASERDYVANDIIPAGGMSPFFAYAQGIEFADIDDTQIDIQFKNFDEDSYHGFTYSTEIAIVQLNWTAGRVVGEVRNEDEYPLRLVRLAIIGYDENDEIVAVERATVDADPIEPGATAGFSNSLLGHDDVPARVAAVAQGVRVRD